MAQIPVTIREKSKQPHKADVVCTNHGNAMNCPTADCPGIPRPNAPTKEGDAVNRKVLSASVQTALDEYRRVTGRDVSVVVDDGDDEWEIASGEKSK